MSSRVWGKKARNRQAIMDAAKSLFEKEGLQRATFNDIAEEAGMSRTTIFNHFPTINDLLLALADEEYQNLEDYYETSRLEGRELIMSLMNRMIDDACKYPVLTTKLITTVLVTDEEKEMYKGLLKMLEDNMDPELSTEEKHNLCTMLIGDFLGLLMTYFLRDYDFDANHMKRRFAILASKVF